MAFRRDLSKDKRVVGAGFEGTSQNRAGNLTDKLPKRRKHSLLARTALASRNQTE